MLESLAEIVWASFESLLDWVWDGKSAEETTPDWEGLSAAIAPGADIPQDRN